MMNNSSNFNRLVIESNMRAWEIYGIASSEWNKGKVLCDLNDSGLLNCYPDQYGWCRYIVSHVMMDVEDYDESLISAFLESPHNGELTLELYKGGKVTFIKLKD